MQHIRMTAVSFAAGIAVWLVGPLPAQSADVQFTERVISTNTGGAWSVFATDVDGDGDIDVLSASVVDDKIAWYESDGGSPPIFTKRVISTTANNPYSVFATDVDGDGDTDVLSASYWDDKIAWYENDGGSPPAFTERIISFTANGAQSVFATDVDGDGDTDVLSASRNDDKIAWYESDGGSPPGFTERIISTTANGAQSVFAIDVDGDGNTDVLSASYADDKIAWYESDGGSPPSFTERVISTSADWAYFVFATDVDGDGDTDVLSASLQDDKIAWYESDGGSPPNFTERVISTTANGVYSVFATDVDGDGDIDVLSASYHDDKIAWYESDGGSPPNFTERVISTAAEEAISVFAVDLDGDGDTDVLSASSRDRKIAWYENTQCGDGVVEGSEECDDGNTTVGDGCDENCIDEICGNSVVQLGNGEQCDDGNTANGDGCDALCVIEFCGDSLVNNSGTEQCDDGNTAGGDGCDDDCKTEICGNGVVQPALGEECDYGNTASGDGCDALCVIEFCGDSLVNNSTEQCDDGNTADCDGCRGDCSAVEEGTCGDGTLDPICEECDDGGTVKGDGCDENCEFEHTCSDGNLELGEQCDDGNTANGDGCNENCLLEGPVAPTVTGGISSRYIQFEPSMLGIGAATEPVAFRVECNGVIEWVHLTHIDYPDPAVADGSVNVGKGDSTCDNAYFLTPDVWTSSGANPLYVTGLSVAPASRPTVYAVWGDCTTPQDSIPAQPTTPTWVYCDSGGDGQVTFFNDLFRQFNNSASGGGGSQFRGPDPGIEVDTQGDAPSVPDQQVTTAFDVFPAFLATTAGGGATWSGEVCP